MKNIFYNLYKQIILKEEDYRGLHKAPSRNSGSPLYDLSGTYPDDVYSDKAAIYYGHYGHNNIMDVQSIKIIKAYHNKPDAIITIYRAVPNRLNLEINNGDWVTINKQYAKDHGRSQFGNDYKLIEKKVRAKDIFTNGDSIHEWGYDPIISHS